MLERMFKANENPVDRVLRIVVGLVLLSLVFIGPKTYIGLVGLILVVTGLAGSCPIYSVFGISTRKASQPAS